MKRVILFITCAFFLFAAAGCLANNSDDTLSYDTLSSGMYYIVGNYEEYWTPYVYVNTEDNTFRLGEGSMFSYALPGSFEIVDGKIVTTSDNMTFVFEIKDSKTLILVDRGDNPFNLPENSKFVFCEEIR